VKSFNFPDKKDLYLSWLSVFIRGYLPVDQIWPCFLSWPYVQTFMKSLITNQSRA
jgi:hypothetical protein